MPQCESLRLFLADFRKVAGEFVVAGKKGQVAISMVSALQ